MWTRTTLGSALLFLFACGDSTSASGGGGVGAGGESSMSTSTSTGTSMATGGEGTGGQPPGVPPDHPVIFYTDLASAPPGAYITLWGRGFGDTAGTASLGGSALSIVTWTDGEMEAKLPDDATAGDLVVHTEAGDSPGVALGIHAGAIYFVASNGDDSWSGALEDPSGGDGPFATITRGRDALGPGDVLYVRAGTFTELDDYNAVLAFRDVPAGSADAPIAVVAYPNEVVTIGDGTLERSFSIYHGDAGPPMDYLTLAKFVLHPSCDAIEGGYGNHGRFVGNDVSGASDACQNGVVEMATTSGWRILGNHLHDNGNTKLEHGIYLGGYGTQTDFEIAYNLIEDQHGGRGIQLFGHQPQDRIEDISIHDNVIADIDRDGIVLGDTDADVLYLDGVSIVDNVFVRAGRCVGAGVRLGNATITNVSILHNTFVDNGAGTVACDQSAGELGSQLLFENLTDAVIRDNILAAIGPAPYSDAQVTAGVTADHNLFFGQDSPDSWDAAPVSGDPKFVNQGGEDFHLGAGSAAIDTGVDAGVARDHDGIARPQGPGFDIGAYEASP